MRSVVLALALALVALAAPAAHAQAQPYASLPPCPAITFETGTADQQFLRAGLICLVNRVRRLKHRRLLHHNKPLARTAQRRTQDMVDRGYFDHIGPDGERPEDFAHAWMPSQAGAHWKLGEVLAWGCGRRSTPQAIVLAWMASAPHRKVLLSRRYNQAGVGLVEVNGCSVWTLDAGSRTRSHRRRR